MISRVATLILIIGLTCSVGFTQETRRDLNSTVTATGLKTIVVDGSVGSVRLTPSDDSKVTIGVHLKAESSWSFWLGREQGDPSGIELITDVRGTELRITLRGDRKHIEETWTVQAPAGLEARVRVGVGSIDVRGFSGGCDARVSVGSVRIDVPEGHVSATTDVGDVKVRTATKSYGNVDVKANVGDMRVLLDGHRVPAPKSYGPGGHLSMPGPGKDRINIRANVGDAELSIR